MGLGVNDKVNSFGVTVFAGWGSADSYLYMIVGFRYGKKHFVKIVTSLVTVLLKMTLCLCIYFVFILSLLKIDTLKPGIF